MCTSAPDGWEGFGSGRRAGGDRFDAAMTAVAPTGGGGSGASLTNEVHAFLDPPARAPTGQLASDRKTPWLSPFLWPYVVVNGQQQYNVLQFSPEHFRFWGYLLFILILAIGKVITDHFSWAPGAYEQRRCQARADCPLDLRNPFNDTFLAWHSDKQAFVQEHMGPLQAAYGYINPCAYLDFPPANQILPLFWVFTMMCFCSSFFFGTIRCRADVQVSTLYARRPIRDAPLTLQVLCRLATRNMKPQKGSVASVRDPTRSCGHAASGKHLRTPLFLCASPSHRSRSLTRAAVE